MKVGTPSILVNIAMGFAELVIVKQNPAAAVEMKAAADGLIPTAGAVATTMGISIADRADRECTTRCAAIETTITTTTKPMVAQSPRSLTEVTACSSHCATPLLVIAVAIARVAAMKINNDQGTVFKAAGH